MSNPRTIFISLYQGSSEPLIYSYGDEEAAIEDLMGLLDTIQHKNKGESREAAETAVKAHHPSSFAGSEGLAGWSIRVESGCFIPQASSLQGVYVSEPHKLEESKKSIARGILLRYEVSKRRVAKRIDTISRKDTHTEGEMKKWKALELYQLNLRNENQTVLDTFVELGIFSDVEAVEAVALAAQEAEKELP